MLDCSRLASATFWFGLGAAAAVLVMAGASRGNWPKLLHVGKNNPSLPAIERELGNVEAPDDRGHDGQLYYMVARDPFGVRGGPQAIELADDVGPRYRYRRILFPMLAGGFGQLDGRATLIGMILLSAVGMGLGMLAVADLAHQLKVRGGAVIVAAMHPGALVSLNLLTADTLAIGLALGGLALTGRGRVWWAVAAFVLATLTKDIYCVVSLAASVWIWRRHGLRHALAAAVLPLLCLAVWDRWVLSIAAPPVDAVTIFGPPFAGLLEAIPLWIRYEEEFSEFVLAATSLFMLMAAAWMIVKGQNALLRLTLAPWLVIACISALRMWSKPNNAARGFALLWPLSVLLLSQWSSLRAAQKNARAVRSGA